MYNRSCKLSGLDVTLVVRRQNLCCYFMIRQRAAVNFISKRLEIPLRALRTVQVIGKLIKKINIIFYHSSVSIILYVVLSLPETENMDLV